MRKPESTAKTFTYQARLRDLEQGGLAALDAYAELFSRAERTLFARSVAANTTAASFKTQFCRQFGLTARQFNALRISLDGKISSIKERRKGLIDEMAQQIKRAEAVMRKLRKQPRAEAKQAKTRRLGQLHHKGRRLATLQARLAAFQRDQADGIVRIAFGSRKLLRAQFALADNDYGSHDEWLHDWRVARSQQFMVIGSKDETAGCQGCVATAREDGLFDLRLRLPHAVGGEEIKHIDVRGIEFAHGAQAIRSALASSRVVNRTSAGGKAYRGLDGTALTYRFLRDDKGWRVFVSVTVPAVAICSDAALGAIGVDFNADHLALAELDRHGNLVAHQRIDVVVRGKSTDQRHALMGDAVKIVVARAAAARKPIAIERLDFSDKKAQLEAVDPVRARIISALAYRDFASMLKAAAFRAGVTVMQVNPAYTSVIGAVNHATRLGISVHLAAAMAIPRRFMGLSEKATANYVNQGCRDGIVVAPARNGGHVTFTLPARNRAKHVWSHWSKIRSELSVALAGHRRCGKAKAAPPPLAEVLRLLGAIRRSRVRPPSANRHQHCSGERPASGLDQVGLI